MKDLIRKMWVKFFEERGKRERLQKTAISIVLIAAVVSATVFVAVTPAHTLEAEAVLSCGKEEHVHDGNCFTEQAKLICGLEESAEEHTHTEECYETEPVLTCVLEEHIHGAECYTQVAEAPAEETGEAKTETPGTKAPEDTVIPEEETGAKEELPEETKAEATPSEAEEATPSEVQEATPSEPEGDVEYTVTLSDGLVITMTGPADAFPEGTLTMRAVELHQGDADYEAAFQLLSGETEGEVVLEQRIFDICLLDEDGNEVQPEKEVKVTFSQVLNGQEQGVQIHHLDTEANVAESMDTFVDGGDVSMETGHFSYYSMTRAGSGAVTIDGTSYPNLLKAVQKVQDGQTIVLQQDIQESVSTSMSNATKFTIDVNGRTWTGNGKELLTVSSGKELTLTSGKEGGVLKAVDGYRVLTTTAKCTINIDNLKLQGNGTGTAKQGNTGGIISSTGVEATISMKNCELTGGKVSGDGGALYIQNGRLTAENCIFEGNTGGSSGAVFLRPWSSNTAFCSASFSDCHFLNNSATTASMGGGGAITASNTSASREVVLHLTRCEFVENTSARGGGAVYFKNYSSKPSEKFTIVDSVFSKNSAATSYNGGAVLIDRGASEISGTRFLENRTPSGYGGGVFVQYNTNIQDTVFEGNHAACGGAIGTSLQSKQTLNLSRVTANRNEADKDGGAIYDNAGNVDRTLVVTDCRMEGNTAARTGGAIWTYSGTVEILGDTIITGNTARAEYQYSGDFSQSAGGIYLGSRKGASYTLAETAHVYKNQTPNVITGGGPVEIYISSLSGVTLKGMFEGNTVTDAGSVYTLEKTADGKSYYNRVMEPERIYLDPAEEHTHEGNSFVAKTLEEAVAHAKETSAEKIYVCSPVTVTPENQEYMNTEEAITFSRCGENRNYLFQVKGGEEVTFERTWINGELVDADYALVLVPSGATLNIKGDTVIEAGKNVNSGSMSLGGGGLRVSGTLNMSGGTIQGNQSNGSGGGIYALNATLNFTGGSILNNQTHGDGGGIHLSGAGGTLSVTKGEEGGRTLIKGNSADGAGGGIMLRESTKAEIYHAEISNNASKIKGLAAGGGIHVWAGASLKMKNLYVTDNYQPGSNPQHPAVYTCNTGRTAVFELEGALITENKGCDIRHQESPNNMVYISSHVLGGGDANWSASDLWGTTRGFSANSQVNPGAKDTAKAMAESEGVIMTGNWANGWGTAIANNGVMVVGTEEMSLTINKVWKDVNGNEITDTSQYKEVPENLRVYLAKSLNNGASERVTTGERADAEVKLNRNNRWTYTWEKLGDSEAVKWLVEEDMDDAAGFEADISEKVQDTSWPSVVQKHYIITITNTEKSELDIAVEKEWIDQDNANGWRPEGVTAQLWRSDNTENPFKTQTLNVENDWSCTFEKLPKYDNTGTKYVYAVKEIPVENYTSEISEPRKGEKGTAYTITNTAYGKVQLKKTLDSYNETLGGAMFVFDVKATLEDEVLFNDVFTADFQAPGTQTIDIGEFPVGTEITVEEVYSGSSYALSGSDKTQNLTIRLNPESTGVVDVLAEYLNTYDDKLVPGTGVRNHYEKNGGGWTGSQAAQ